MRSPSLLLCLLLLAGCGEHGASTTLTSPALLQVIPEMSKGLSPSQEASPYPTIGTPSLVSLRGFYAFPLDGLPAGAVVTQAVLRFQLTETVGSPFAMLGDLAIFPVDLGTSLDPMAHFNGPTTNTGEKLDQDPTPGSRVHDVTDWVKSDVDNGRSTAGFRLQFDMSVIGPHYVTLDDPNDADYAGPATLEVHFDVP